MPENPADIHVTPPEEPEVHREIYKDVEPLLYTGFLTLSARINDVNFVFKNLNHHEFEQLRLGGVVTSNPKLWDKFLAFGVYMIDGINVLSDRSSYVPLVVDSFAKFPKDTKLYIVRHLSELNRRASNATSIVEAYSLEVFSRYRWLQLKGLDLTSTAVTGVVGTPFLGLNWAQQLWRALNLAEDRNEQIERDWDNAKFIGSCFNGKGMSKVYAQDSDRRGKEKRERMARKDRILREVLLGEKFEDSSSSIPGAVITVPRTVKELAVQLEKDLKGEKDWHDHVIEEHEKRIMEGYKSRQDQRATFHSEDAEVRGGTQEMGLTIDEVNKRISAARYKEISQSIPYNQQEQDLKTEAFLDKWGKQRSPVVTTPLPIRNFTDKK